MTTRDMNICDDCSMPAYDLGIGGNELLDDDWDHRKAWVKQVAFMVTMGEEMPDHECTAKMEPDLNIQCDCGCNPGRFEWHQKRRREARR
jgi:hypothetical protein